MELREYILNNMDNLDIDIETMNKISDFILEFEENRKTQKCNMCMYCNNSPEEKDNLFFCFNIHTPVRLIGNKDKTLNFGCDLETSVAKKQEQTGPTKLISPIFPTACQSLITI